MTRSHRGIFAPIVIGVSGVAILIGLCVWQIQRMTWKEALIDTLEARLSSEPVALPAGPDAADEFLRVRITGRFDDAPGGHGFADAPFLTTREREPGYRIIQPFATSDGRHVMVDRGFLPASLKNEDGRAVRPTPAPAEDLTLTGALRFPDETADPPFGARDNVWVARDLAAMARIFGTEPVLVVSETPTAVGGAWPQPMPLTVDLPNSHLNYAITWGSLALVWAVMAGVWLRRELAASKDG
ncbi:SURF1 family protein [Limibaculum sp. M0105]|uniref:SURF1-like protein n=1 Tax=Thermohalobaculum xanthum TaxID=2753746 RepID=A0A8J7M4E1_9RHOB|nr:SURF1 family protein [Thermohalobaculum xanthum]MBK0397920.1 SURF1 family protein [Thermohalobaculum xanthum]